MFLLNGLAPGRRLGQVQLGIPKESAGIAASPGVTADMHKERVREREWAKLKWISEGGRRDSYEANEVSKAPEES